MQLDWAIHTLLIQERFSHSYQSKHHMWRLFVSNFLITELIKWLSYRNGWPIVVKYATTAVYARTHFSSIPRKL